LSIPGGNAHAALGAEYMRTRSDQNTTNPPPFLPNPPLSYTQKVTSLFSELQIPVVGKSNSVPLVSAVNVSASGRYDKYNDFGHTYNPTLGLTYEPVDWISMTGKWGKSFAAPS